MSTHVNPLGSLPPSRFPADTCESRAVPVSFVGEARTDDIEGEKRLEQSYASPGTASPVSSKVRVERWNLENLVQLS